jgi:1,4-alpha-glucan branching enzyme
MYVYMFMHPGGKLLFMGNEFGATDEWNHKRELQWYLLKYELHRKMKDCVRDLNLLLRSEPALYENQFNKFGFEWIDLDHRQESVIVFRRKGRLPENDILVVLNMTPVPRNNWKVFTNGKSAWKEIFNSDERIYGGTGNIFNPEPIVTLVDKEQDRYEINVHLPPLGAVILK